MSNYHAMEDTLSTNKHVNDYYPDIVRFHKNELLSYLDCLNTDYVVKRKKKLNAVQSKDEAIAYIDEVKAAFAGCLGEIPGGPQVHANVVKTLDKGRYWIDNVLIESLPGYFLSANFYYPKGDKRPRPAILFLCGHSENGKAYGMYVSFCVEAVLNGFCVLTFDPVGQGERRMYDKRDSEHFNGSPDTVHYLLGQQAWLVGSSITTYMMGDNIKALDYLCSREEADCGAITVAGNSGGGHMAAFMGACDPRISAVVSSCYITELSSMIHHIGAQECEQSLPGFMERGLDLADLVIAAAPRPYFIGASLMDFFPIDGTRDAWIDARRIYRLFESQANLEMNIEPKPHGFWGETRERALRFLCRHFDMDFIEETDIDYANLPSEQELLCVDTGDINDCNATTLQQMLMEKGKAILPAPPAIRDAGELNAFCGSVRKNLVDVLKIDFDRIDADICTTSCGIAGDSQIHVTDYSFQSEEYMKIFGTLYERERGTKASVLVHIGNLDVRDNMLYKYLEEFSAVFCVETRGRGRGTVEPGCYFYEPGYFENEEASYNCTVEMLGRNVAGMRTHDALSAMKLLGSLKEFGNCAITLGGNEENALTALYAAVILGGKDVRLEGLLQSFQSIVGSRMYLWGPSVFVYDLLKYFDIPGLLAALARNKVKIDGLLDHMKSRVNGERLHELTGSLHQSFAIGGGYLEIS